ncbi:Smr/MutS family protein [Robertkochia solimangrovi]|uniref:Smr/MutS family protein n=1 Tax=Robertkochia solimangrovi TaxID=2213046 RepID=UPI00117E8442|nr:Smr/MutS family protein [Robertkochia solimangrovi]TRZ43765.1 DNA mismatch repair protein MutS [Robertkochia solimangrovi]
MAFKSGDRVETIDDQLKGVVTGVVGGEVLVTTEDGFDLRLSPGELILLPNDGIMEVSNLEAYRALKDKQQGLKKRKTSVKRDKTQPPMEVDLHIHKLTNEYRNLANHDMLILQVDTAKRKLDFAISKRIQRVVFIHGVGEGVLRTELEYLFSRYEGLSWYDADYQKYGLGATEVYIPQNTRL